MFSNTNTEELATIVHISLCPECTNKTRTMLILNRVEINIRVHINVNVISVSLIYISVFFVVCEDYFYNDTCTAACGSCLNGETCNKQKGTCAQGCKDNFSPPFCQGILIFITVNSTTYQKYSRMF